MAKLTLSNVASFVNDTTAVSTTTANNDAIEAAMENTLSRDGTSPNTMGADFDMNSNFILNLPNPTANAHAANKAYVDLIVVGAGNVPGAADPGDDGKILTASGGGWTWQPNGAQPLDATLTAIAALSTSADDFIYATGSDTFTTATITSFGRTLVANASAADARTDLGLVIGTDVQAYDADTAKLDVDQVWTGSQRPTVTALTSTTNSIAIELNDSNDFSHTFTEDTTLANPTSTAIPGQSGSIYLTQHASAPKTLAFGSEYDFVGGTAPTITASNSARDRLDYVVRADGQIEITALLNLS